MKFALIVFLGLFAISAQAKPSEAVKALLPESIYNFVQELLAAAGGLNEKVQSTIEIIKKITQSVLYLGFQQVNEAGAKVEHKLTQYGGGRTDCVKKHSPSLKVAKTILESNIKKCVKPLVEKSEATKDDLQDTIKIVKESISSFYNVGKECAGFNPIATAKCIQSHMGHAKKIVMDLIHDTEAKLERIITGNTELSKESAVCIKNALQQFNTTRNKVFGLIDDCIKQIKDIRKWCFVFSLNNKDVPIFCL